MQAISSFLTALQQPQRQNVEQSLFNAQAEPTRLKTLYSPWNLRKAALEDEQMGHIACFSIDSCYFKCALAQPGHCWTPETLKRWWQSFGLAVISYGLPVFTGALVRMLWGKDLPVSCFYVSFSAVYCLTADTVEHDPSMHQPQFQAENEARKVNKATAPQFLLYVEKC